MYISVALLIVGISDQATEAEDLYAVRLALTEISCSRTDLTTNYSSCSTLSARKHKQHQAKSLTHLLHILDKSPFCMNSKALALPQPARSVSLGIRKLPPPYFIFLPAASMAQGPCQTMVSHNCTSA